MRAYKLFSLFPLFFIFLRPFVDVTIYDFGAPFLRVLISVLAILIFSASLLAVGRGIEIAARRYWVLGALSTVDAMVCGLFWIISVGTFSGFVVGLSLPVYLVLCLLPVAFLLVERCPKHFSFISYPSWRVSTLAVGIVLFSLFFLIAQIVEDIPLQNNVDYSAQYFFIVDEILNAGRFVPNMLAFENKIHEYYYSIAMGMPFVFPAASEGMALLGLFLQLFIPVFIFSVLLRLMPESAAIAGAAFFTILFVGLIFNEHSNTIIKYNMRFMIFSFAAMGFYLIIFAKGQRPIYFFFASFSAGMLAGTTVVGGFAALPFILFVLVEWFENRVERKILFMGLAIAGGLAMAPKLVNLAVAGTVIDYTTKVIMGIPDDILFSPLPQYSSVIDSYVENYRVGKSGQFDFQYIITYLLRFGGAILLISAWLNWTARRTARWRVTAILLELHVFVAMFVIISLSFRHSIFFIPFYGWAIGNTIYFAFCRICKWRYGVDRRPQDSLAGAILPVAVAFVLLLIDARGFSFIYRNPPAPIISYLRIEEAIVRSQEASDFRESAQRDPRENALRKDEVVLVLGELANGYAVLQGFYKFKPIFYSSLQYARIFTPTIEESIMQLRLLGVERILIEPPFRSPLPRPGFLEPEVASRLFYSVPASDLLPLSVTEYSKQKASLLILKEEGDSMPDQEVFSLMSKYKFNQDPEIIDAINALGVAVVGVE